MIVSAGAAAHGSDEFVSFTQTQPAPYLPSYTNSAANTTSSQNPWTIGLTQTADYGTSLALPISLTPLNTLIAPVTDLALAAIPNPDPLGAAGLLDNVGLSGIVTPDIDVVSIFRDDFQFQTNAMLLRNFTFDDASAFSGGYSYYQSLHPEVKQVDLQTHTVLAQYARRTSDRAVVGLNYNFSYYYLQGQSYVSQNRIAPTLSIRRNDLWDIQMRADYTRADFRSTPFLDSNNYSTQTVGIRYVGGERINYIAFGLASGYSDAVNEGFSYIVNSPFITTRWAFSQDRRTSLLLTAAYAYYDFRGTDPIQVGTKRADQIISFTPTLTRSITDTLTLFALYNYYNSDSNVQRQVYHQNLISFGVSFLR